MDNKPFRIVLLGDFSGRKNIGSRRGAEVKRPEVIPFDRYDFLNLFDLLEPELQLPALIDNDPPISLKFREMDDFHPDTLVERIPFLNRLSQISERLEIGVGFEEAFKEIRAAVADFSASGVSQRDFVALNEEKEPFSTLVEECGVYTSGQLENDTFTDLLGRTVKPYLTKEITPRQEEIISVFKEFFHLCLRAIMRHPDFQSLEASWRSLFFLVSRLETTSDLELHLLDISKKEILDDILDSGKIQESFVYRLLVKNGLKDAETKSWDLLAGDYFFSDCQEDIRLLQFMGDISKLAQASFIAGADSAIIAAEISPRESDSQISKEWQNLRLCPNSTYIGLITPRFLVRLPYGKETSRCERVDFEELSSVNSHQEYLWGNSAFLGVYLLGDAFLKFGWKLSDKLSGNIDSLPLHVYRQGGETKLKPCAEVILSAKENQAITRLGLIPLYSVPGADEVHFGDFRSLALPLSRLMGGWS